MTEAIGIRLDDEFLKDIDKIGKEESLDRSTILRKLLNIGYKDFLKNKAKEDYVSGKISLSKAAKIAGLTIWEMQKYLVEKGYKSEYSIKDLEDDLKKLNVPSK
ncbi:UPF0175 family protein [Candidatus Woesearchaeota archaeon]|nr:UPF0175 family protein [Candidatus Woesearchaeota archaeon]